MSKLNFFRKISISLIIGFGFPIIANAGVESEIHKMCSSTLDYKGCVELNSYKSSLPECYFPSEEEAAIDGFLRPLSLIENLIKIDSACQGSYTLDNGEKYVGEFLKREPHGQGAYTWSDGEKYVGEFAHGYMHGQGTFTYDNGDIYVGEFSHNVRQGQGTYTWANGDNWSGTWSNNEQVKENIN